jgi:phosphoribosylglycinamide formyltransferase-1
MAQLNVKTRLKLGILISGRGSNLQALIDAAADPAYPAEIALVISNRADAGGLARAEAAGIATTIIPHKEFASREAFDAALDQALRAAGVGLVCLAGFMRLLTPGFSESWRDRLINIHPSLLPSFKGLDSHAQALAAGVRFSGCSVHFVRPAMDAGPIILQAAVPVRDGDDEERLAARILEAEHKCYPLAVRLIAEGRVKVVDEIVRIAEGKFADAALLNPLG